MCLILFSFKASKSWPLVLAANRDEFYSRPTAPMDFWDESPSILAGRDLEQGGTWLGIHARGRFAALTNYREPTQVRKNAPSRGSIIPEFLESRGKIRDFLKILDRGADLYNGFNLLAGEIRNRDIILYWYSNRARETVLVSPGIHGLSNCFLDTDWPKVSRGKAMLEQALNPDKGHERKKEPSRLDKKNLFTILEDSQQPEDSKLPNTGVGIEWERILSPLFVQSPTYGTRSSTLLTINRDGEFAVTERSHFPGVPAKDPDRQFRFRPD
ncbi:NRDE family protein [Desulfospira joergensenii]|uniref:NRDE family protein n=1 Tax=Desulfospira joergensenii TaxID=53329 RepID=UPI0003B54959|nr:NRDE family protein [Desulfospira joergensenii]